MLAKQSAIRKATSEPSSERQIYNALHSGNIFTNAIPKSFASHVKNRNKNRYQAAKFSIDRDWLTKAKEEIELSEYNIQFNERKQVQQSFNRNQNLAATYTPTGFNITPGKINKNWFLQFDVKGVCRKNSLLQIVQGTTEPELNKNSIRYKSSSGLIMEYINAKEGIRQNFYLPSKPAGRGKVQLVMQLKTNLLIKQQGIKELNLFAGIKGKLHKELTYNSLHVWDESHNELDAAFFLNNDKLIIEFDDSHAIYPVTIDPLSTTPSWSVKSTQKNDMFGYSVASAGDVNGDGYDDVIIGAPNYGVGLVFPLKYGRAFLYKGSASGLDTAASQTLDGEQALSAFGSVVASAGDVNGDGFSDVLVLANGFKHQGKNGLEIVGKVYIFHGSAGGLNTAAQKTFLGDNSNPPDDNGGGRAANAPIVDAAPAGDFNGDGFDDIVIGKPNYDPVNDPYYGQNSGQVTVYVGSSNGITEDGVQRTVPPDPLPQHMQNELFGISVAGAGDVNGDGYDDVIAGAPGYSGPGILQDGFFKDLPYHGAGIILYGHPLNCIPTNPVIPQGFFDILINPANPSVNQIDAGPSAGFGNYVSSAGDVNGDGFYDVVVGTSKTSSITITNSGTLHLYYGSRPFMDSIPHFIPQTPITGFAPAGDINNDGFDDVILSQALSSSRGGIYVKYGSSSGLGAAKTVFKQNGAQTFSLSSAGDVNNDGFNDVVIGKSQQRFGMAELYQGSGPKQTKKNCATPGGFTLIGYFKGHSYYKSNSSFTWPQASTLAHSLGGYVATISSRDENNFIYRNGVKNTRIPQGSYNNGTFWIGLNDKAREGTFVSDNGEPVRYTRWDCGEPNNFVPGEDYVEMLPWNGRWNDYFDDTKLPFILEIDCIPAASSVEAAADSIYFTAIRNAQYVNLTWKTMPEQNSNGFNVQRNTNGNWENIAFVNSKTTDDNSGVAYSYKDINKEEGITHYRIQQVNAVGTAKFSTIKVISGLEQQTKMLLFPNPAIGGKTTILFGDANGKHDVLIMDMSGRIIKRWVNVSSSNLQIENLNSGFYSVQIINTDSGKQTTKKLVVNN